MAEIKSIRQAVWPNDLESKRAISVLNKWISEVERNGGENAEYELRSNPQFFFYSEDFNRYLHKAADIIEELKLSGIMPTTLSYIASNGKRYLSPSSGSSASEETFVITNYEELQIENLSFIKLDENPIYQFLPPLLSPSGELKMNHILLDLDDLCEDHRFEIKDGQLVLFWQAKSVETQDETEEEIEASLRRKQISAELIIIEPGKDFSALVALHKENK